jgi:hypothetical protein
MVILLKKMMSARGPFRKVFRAALLLGIGSMSIRGGVTGTSAVPGEKPKRKTRIERVL